MDNTFLNHPQEYLSFYEVALQGGFRKAATRLNLSKSVISARVKALEERLRTKLFQRSTRSVRLTVEGKSLLTECEKLVQQLRIMESLSLGDQLFTGRLRISAPVDLSSLWLAPLLFEFQRLHPTLRIELVSTNEALDFEKDGIDLSLRVNAKSHGHLFQQALGTVRFGLFCHSRSKLADQSIAERIATAEETGVVALRHARLKVEVGKLQITLKQHRLFKVNDLLCAKSLLLNECETLVALPRFTVNQELIDNTVIDALGGSGFDASKFYLVSGRKTSEDPRLQSLVEFLKKHWAQS